MITEFKVQPVGAAMRTFTFSGLRTREFVISDSFFVLYDRLLGETEMSGVMREAAVILRKVLHAEQATVYVVREETGTLESVAMSGHEIRTIRVPIGPGSLAGYCAHARQAILVPDAYGDLSVIDPRLTFDRSWDESHGFRTRDVPCAPVVFRDRLEGVVQVLNSADDPFDASDLQGLQTVARVVGYALHHARMYDDLATMKALEKEKARFMRVMVHELKAPIAAVATIVDSYRVLAHGATPPGPEQSLRLVDRIGARMASMLTTVKDILQHSAIKAGDALGEVKDVDLGQAARAALEEHRAQAGHKGLALTLAVAAAAPRVRIDEKALMLVLSNLVSNGVKYTASGGVRVAIEAGGEPPEALIRVADTGMGIPPDDLPRMFSEFFRASNARAARIEGTGVGLAGVRDIVERFGGGVGVESEVGRGSTFTVRLPLAPLS
jgi:signal transduction histidine kinase